MYLVYLGGGILGSFWWWYIGSIYLGDKTVKPTVWLDLVLWTRSCASSMWLNSSCTETSIHTYNEQTFATMDVSVVWHWFKKNLFAWYCFKIKYIYTYIYKYIYVSQTLRYVTSWWAKPNYESIWLTVIGDIITMWFLLVTASPTSPVFIYILSHPCQAWVLSECKIVKLSCVIT